MSTSARCASGARSPEADTEPWAGITGTMPALNTAKAWSTSFGRTPEWPRDRLAMRSAKASRLTAGDSGSPTPQAWLRTRLTCNSPSLPAGISVWASLPKPVLSP